MFGEQIVQEIDKTLDQLIQNAEVISVAELQDLSEAELEAFQKTQESLLQRLMHMDELLSIKSKDLRLDRKVPLQEKLFQFHKLKSQYTKTLSETVERRRILSKRRGKRFFDLRFRKSKNLICK